MTCFNKQDDPIHTSIAPGGSVDTPPRTVFFSHLPIVAVEHGNLESLEKLTLESTRESDGRNRLAIRIKASTPQKEEEQEMNRVDLPLA